ncbi:MAG: PLP-dependent lyase/thiolase [Acidimicrobiales bacterium]
MADANPFLLHRQHLDVYQHALEQGLTDADYRALVIEADDRVAAVDGAGFLVTPVVELCDLPEVAAPVIAKIETGNVGGSHKARHLFGLLLNTMIGERAEGVSAATDVPLAIASCGNAALGAAVVARAVDRTLQVFVPSDADPTIVARLDDLGAEVQHCERRAGEAGDPCVLRLHEAIATGARPFTVQGPVCPEVIDGCRTLGLELAGQLDELGVEPRSIYVQIGGGALATAVMDGLWRAWPGRGLPALHPVQAQSAHPYVAAWRRFAAGVLDALGVDDPGSDEARASLLTAHRASFDLDDALAGADEMMVPWPGTPASVASGILDDVTYDWRTVLRHQIDTGGHPILVGEATFVAARELAAPQADPPPDETGAAGLAGLLTHAATSPSSVTGPAVVLLTG